MEKTRAWQVPRSKKDRLMGQLQLKISLKYGQKNLWKEFKDMSPTPSTRKNFRIVSFKFKFYHHFVFRFHKSYKKKGIWPSKKEAVDAWNVKRKYFYFIFYLSLKSRLPDLHLVTLVSKVLKRWKKRFLHILKTMRQMSTMSRRIMLPFRCVVYL